jgi:hypothetical protein
MIFHACCPRATLYRPGAAYSSTILLRPVPTIMRRDSTPQEQPRKIFRSLKLRSCFQCSIYKLTGVRCYSEVVDFTPPSRCHSRPDGCALRFHRTALGGWGRDKFPTQFGWRAACRERCREYFRQQFWWRLTRYQPHQVVYHHRSAR